MGDQIVSLSGGKDSCATAIVMRQLGIPITAMVAVIPPWEFEVMDDVFKRMEDIIGIPVTKLYPVPFDWWMTQRPVVGKDKKFKGFGAGWPSRENGRWCTREKFNVFDKYVDHHFPSPVRCVGFAVDELHRIETPSMQERMARGQIFRFPLIEAGLIEEQALRICYDHGIDWGGLYEKFRTGRRTPRLSCWCCPHQPIPSLRILRRDFPEKWAWMISAGKGMWNPIFKNGLTMDEWEARFAEEDHRDKQQLKLFA